MKGDILWKGSAAVKIVEHPKEKCALPYRSPFKPISCRERIYAIKGWDSLKISEYEFAEEGSPLLIYGGLGSEDRAHYYAQGRGLWSWQAMTHYIFLPREVNEFKRQLDPEGEFFKNFWGEFPLSHRTGDYSWSRDTLLGLPLRGDYYCVLYRQNSFDYRLCRGKEHLKFNEFQGWINRFDNLHTGGSLRDLGTWYRRGDRLLFPLLQNEKLWLVEGMVPLHYALSWIKAGINLED